MTVHDLTADLTAEAAAALAEASAAEAAATARRALQAAAIAARQKERIATATPATGVGDLLPMSIDRPAKTRKPAPATGVVLYYGPSVLDGGPIVVILTGLTASANRKTGAVLQTWIMRADRLPVDALADATDSTVCGQCVFRPDLANAARDAVIAARLAAGWKTTAARAHTGIPRCYVNVGQAPQQIFKTWRAGRYPVADAESLAELLGGDYTLRLGAYGDPAAVPFAGAWRAAIDGAAHILGYTHQWAENPDAAAPYKGLCQASVSTPAEARAAMLGGWRVFLVADLRGVDHGLGLLINCPSDKSTHPHTTTCEACKLCNGKKANVWIVPH